MKQRLKISLITGTTVIALGALCMAFTDIQNEWYLLLDKPFWGASGIIPVVGWWASFAVLGACAVLNVFLSKPIALRELYTYALSAALGLLWTFLLFGRHLAVNALVDLIILAAILTFTGLRTVKEKQLQRWVLIPYALWLAYLLSFNYYIVIFN